MNRVINTSFYIAFIVSILVFNSIHVGPFSVRVYFTLMMAMFLLWNKRDLIWHRNYNVYIYLYISFIFFKGIALLLNGEFIEYNFVRNFLAYEFVAIVVYYATIFFAHSKRGLDITLLALSVILLTTSVVTILQYYNNPIGWTIGQFFGELSENGEKMSISSTDEMIGISVTVGILKTAFGNAMFISSIGTLAFGLVYVVNNKCAKLFYLLCGVLGIIACFMTQQRSAFYIMLLSYFTIFFLAKDVKPLIFLLVIAIFLPSLIDISVLGNDEILGRLSTDGLFEDSARAQLIEDAILFIQEHPLVGGPIAYMSLHGMPAHNFFANAFIYGGLIGGIILSYMFFKIIFYAIRQTLKTRGTITTSAILSVSLISYLLQGLFHNESIVFGSTTIFILLPLLLCTAPILVSKNDTNKSRL